MLESALAQIHSQLSNEAKEATTRESKVSVKDVDLYLTVARNLLSGYGDSEKGSEDGGVRRPFIHSKLDMDTSVRAMLANIKSGRIQMEDRKEIYGGQRPVDYSQFIVRGHYRRSAAGRRYFRTMMWLGRSDLGFHVTAPDPNSGLAIDLAREQTDAILLGARDEVFGELAEI